jgi:hypothetical protein
VNYLAMNLSVGSDNLFARVVNEFLVWDRLNIAISEGVKRDSQALNRLEL